ncbi:hypothetical protein [Haloplanus natans]|uniref:hypothetical protein n=1 Tax=Haloplanus natans TaxID=376171 RepID=UPI000677BD23|nr:hypothetical protein [Haloplanus natans]
MGSGDDERPPSGTSSGSDDEGVSAATGAFPSLDRGTAVLLGGLVVALLVAVAIGASGGGTSAAAGADSVSTATPTPATTGTEAAAESPPTITMQVRSIESCSTRCREVTVALTNGGSAPARDVSVTTRITTDGSLVWQGRSDVGRLVAGETVMRTRTVDVGYLDAARIEANDGVVRIETTVRTANGTRVFTERRDVS